MANPPVEKKQPSHAPPKSESRKRKLPKHPTEELPPPTPGKVLTAYLDKVAAKLTPEDLEDLDRAINASRESAR